MTENEKMIVNELQKKGYSIKKMFLLLLELSVENSEQFEHIFENCKE